MNYYYYKCSQCKFLVGFEKNQKSYFLKSKIKIRKIKEININFLSIKEDLLNQIKNDFNDMFDLKRIKININTNLIKKSEIDKFNEYKKIYFDFTFIIHKIEGRIFLLGKNGFYNKIIEKLKSKINGNIFFIFIVKDDNNENNNEMIENLIYKGDEKDLEFYYKNNKIIFLNNYEIRENLNNNENFFNDLFENCYVYDNNDNDNNNENYFEEDILLYNKDKKIIDDMNDFINNGENIFKKCFN